MLGPNPWRPSERHEPTPPAPPPPPARSEAAQEWLAECSSPEEALALALAKITGHTDVKARSLLTAHEGFTTLEYRQASGRGARGGRGRGWGAAGE